MKKGKSWMGRKDFVVRHCYEHDQKLVSPEKRRLLSYFDFTSETFNKREYGK